MIPPRDSGQAPHIARQRAVRLFTFLLEYTRLGTESARTTDSYEEVIWLADMSQVAGCRGAAFDPVARGAEVWIELLQPRLEPAPRPPEMVRPWLEPGRLDDSSLEAPPMLESIPSSGESDPMARVMLDEQPEVRLAYGEFVQRQWSPWAEDDRMLRAHRRLYSDLLRLYRSQQRLGEAYEVVLGVGHLAWRPPGGAPVGRHLIVAQTDVRFDANRGAITVSAAVDGACPALEQDMLEPARRPASAEVQRIASLLARVGDDVFGDEIVPRCLESWVHALSSMGRYENEIARQSETTETPVVHFAPALLLRRRARVPTRRALERIVHQLEGGIPLSRGLRQLVEEPRHDAGSPPDQAEILFPLPANEEQLDIARRLRDRPGVLVQGPPGTGKSHTIANLVAHLLAQGQRVLVTSHTARALQVLRQKLPLEIRDLVVVLLGNDAGGREDLRTSVLELLRRHDCWDPEHSDELISTLRQELADARRAEANTLSLLRTVREQDGYRYPPRFGGYEGTSLEIARELRQRARDHDWIEGQIGDPEGECPLSAEEALDLLRILRDLDDTAEEELRLALPDLADLPGADSFASLVAEETAAMGDAAEFERDREHPAYGALRSAPAEAREAVRSALEDLALARAALGRSSSPWTAVAVEQVIRGDNDRWHQLGGFTTQVLERVKLARSMGADAQVTGVGTREPAVVLADARELLEHLRQGGGLGRTPLRPAAVKRARYLLQEVRVDGADCREMSVLERLVNCLDARIQLDRLDAEWQAVLPVPVGSVSSRLAAYREVNVSLRGVLGLETKLAAVGVATARIPGLPGAAWRDSGTLESFHGAVEAVCRDAVCAEVKARLEAVERSLRQAAALPSVHPAVPALQASIADRDVQRYRDGRDALSGLRKWKRRQSRRDTLLGRLQDRAPALATSLRADPADAHWDSRLAALPDAWDWGRADRWLRGSVDSTELRRLERELDAARQQIEHATRRLAGELAWSNTLRRLTDWERVHLAAWGIAVRNIGAGTGRDAPAWRRRARAALEECRSALPAWIMPVFKVAETMDLVPEAFDVVIVDEASLSGPEALFLQFLARKVVVLGDDQQISSDNAGLDRGQVDLLTTRYLHDVPLRTSFKEESSLLDLTSDRYGDRVTLREHFRCMPEIIQFSNELCYRDRPLIPLKHYGAGRPTPVIQVRHVPDGYVIPGNVNQPEAEALADQVVACFRDPAYDGRTFGVISLVGRYQAKHIERLLAERIEPSEIERRGLVCGEPYAFQGDERDVMFLSLVQGQRDGQWPETLRSDGDRRRFNVAASRAREQLWLFHTATLDDLNPLGMPHRLLQYCLGAQRLPATNLDLDIEALRGRVEAHRDGDGPPPPFENWLEVAVFLQLSDRGYHVFPQCEVAGYRIDLLVEGIEGRLAVECDGDVWHDGHAFDRISGQQRLERCGIPFVHVRGAALERDSTRALEPMWTELQARGIFPAGGSDRRRYPMRSTTSTHTAAP